MSEYAIVFGIVLFCIGFGLAFWIKGKMIADKLKAAEGESEKIIADAKRKSDTLVKEADLEIKDRLFRMKSEFDTETKETRSELKKKEHRVTGRAGGAYACGARDGIDADAGCVCGGPDASGRAGMPAQVSPAGMRRPAVTSAAAPTVASSPISTPGKTIARRPMVAPRRTITRPTRTRRPTW